MNLRELLSYKPLCNTYAIECHDLKFDAIFERFLKNISKSSKKIGFN